MNIGAEPSPAPTDADTVRLPAPKPISEILEAGSDARNPSPVDESAAALEIALQREMDSRREERFYWILFCTILADMAMFPHMTWIGIICIFLLEVVALIGLAKRLGSENVSILLDHLFYSICEKLGWNSGKSD
jgi:hypothetical protein